MAPKRPDENLSLTFTHRGHQFTITAVPDGDDYFLQLADRYGPILLALSIKIAAADVWCGGNLDRQPIEAGMAKVRDAIKQLDLKSFRGLLNTPRAADEFQWTPAELEAASSIDWSKPAAAIVHEGRSFSIGAFVGKGRMVILLRDANGPFNAPFSIPRDSMIRAAVNGTDPLAFGVHIMLAKVRAWSPAQMEAFVKNTPRLATGVGGSQDRR